jgi:DNA ligase-1
MKPMLARKFGPKFDRFPAFAQPKFNGERALCDFNILQSRGEKVWKDSFFPHIIDELRQLQSALKTHILDGELYVHGWKFGRILSACGVNNINPNKDSAHIEYHLFDRVDIHAHFSTRWLDFSHQVRALNLPHIKVAETVYVEDRNQLQSYFNKWTSEGYEGVMIRPDGPYEFGIHEGKNGPTERRSQFLWKYKSWQDSEFICVDVTRGEGKASIGIGALVCTTASGELFNVGTGYSDEERVAFSTNPPIGKLIRVRYHELTELGKPVPSAAFIAVMN